eukprot:scaffold9370_cov152-Skeletonema_marinoi.AAC.9
MDVSHFFPARVVAIWLTPLAALQTTITTATWTSHKYTYMLKRSRDESQEPPAAGGRERRTANEIHKIQEILCPKNRPRKSHFSAHLHAINLSKLTTAAIP